MLCPDTLDLGLPLPNEILESRLSDFYEFAAETRYLRDEYGRTRRSALRRRMLRIARGPCPAVGMKPSVGRKRGACDPLREVAYHEAGHAVACAALGIHMSQACVVDIEQLNQYRFAAQDSFLPPSDTVGLVLYNRDLGTLEGALASAFIAAAGPAAELIVGGSLEDFSWGETIETDESLIQSDVGLMGLACHIVVSRRFGTDDDFRERRRAIVAEHNRVWSAVCRFLADKRTLMALDEVADALTLHGSLKGAEIVHIASRHGVMDVPEIADLHRSTQGGSADAA